MKKKENIVSYSAAELAAMRSRGESQTDWARVAQITEAELEASLGEEEDSGAFDWENVIVGLPQRKREVHIRLDADLLDWLKQNGKGYQTRINAILRSYMKASARKSGQSQTP
ncbi:MAG: BrnA antitoxin family protein [Methylomonas sp.]|jgi:uncharacterized protein (DUF4415 family)